MEILQICGDSMSDDYSIPIGLTGIRRAKVSRYVCLACGFSEDWVESKDDLAKLRKQYGGG